MSKAILSLAISSLSACLACGRAESYGGAGSGFAEVAEFDHFELHPKLLSGDVFVDSGLYMPFALGVVGPYLVVADRTGVDSLLKVYRRESGDLVYATGRLGGGPGEYRSIWGVRPARGSTSTRPAGSIFDFTLRRLTTLDLSPSGLLIPPRNRPLVTLRSEASITSAVWHTDSTIVALGFFRGGRLGFFDRDGRQIKVLGALPTDDPSVPIPVLQHAYQSYLGVKPDGTMLVVVNRHAGRIEIFHSTGDRVGIVRGPYDFEPIFRTATGVDSAATPVFSSGEDLRFGYLAVGVTDSRIFALFSGRVRKAFPGQANFGRFLHVFDWSGRFVRAYDLGQAVFTLDVDSAGRMLYAARHDPEPAVLVFRMTDADGE